MQNVLEKISTVRHKITRKSIKGKLNKTLSMIPTSVFKGMLSAYPLSVGMETTNICNAKCVFCAYPKMKRKHERMDNDIFSKVLEFLSGYPLSTLAMTPIMGDPLTDPIISTRIRALKKAGVNGIFFYTNGILLKNISIESLITSGISRILVSGNFGNANDYMAVFGVDQYDNMLKGLLALLETNKRLGDPVDIEIVLRVPTNKTRQNVGYPFHEIDRHIKRQPRDKFFNWGGRVELPDGYNNVASPKITTCCSEFYRRMHILSSGNITPCACADVDGDLTFGSVRDGRLVDVWRNGALKATRDSFPNNPPEVCKKCNTYEPVENLINNKQVDILRGYLAKRFAV